MRAGACYGPPLFTASYRLFDMVPRPHTVAEMRAVARYTGNMGLLVRRPAWTPSTPANAGGRARHFLYIYFKGFKPRCSSA